MGTVILLIIVGGVLIFLETILPGLIAGVVGFICLIAGVVIAYQLDFATGNLVLMVVLGCLMLGTFAYLKYFPATRAAQMFVSQGTVGELGVEKPELLDQAGTALTALRPSGTAVINGRRVDVVSEGMMIEKGTAIRVVAVEGLKVIVRQAPEAAQDKPQASGATAMQM